MLELRLVDPDGYDAVTDGYKITVTPEQAPAETDRLKTELAPVHAAAHAYARYNPRDYDVRATPLTQGAAPMSSTITIADLAAELGTNTGDISRRVSALCREIGSQRVVHTVVSANARCVLHGEAADTIRAQVTEAA